MKKRALAAALCLVTVFALLPKTARAGAVEVMIWGKSLTAEAPYYHNGELGAQGTVNSTAYEYNAYYDVAKNVLYLNDLNVKDSTATIKDANGASLTYAIFINCTLTLDLSGNNTVSNKDGQDAKCAVFSTNNHTLTVKGSGTLTATGGNGDGDYACGVMADTLVMTDGAINATAGTAKRRSYGLTAATITVNGGSITGTGGTVGGDNSESCGVSAGAGITMNGGSITGTGGGGKNSYGVYASGSITATGGSIKGTGAGSESNNTYTYGVYSGNDIIANFGGIITGKSGAALGYSTSTSESYGLRAINSIAANSGGTITGTGGGASFVSKGVYSDTVTVAGGMLIGVSDASTARREYGVAADDKINLSAGRLVGEYRSKMIAAGALNIQANLPSKYYWRTSKNGDYTQNNYSWSDQQTYVDLRSALPEISFTLEPAEDTIVTEGSINSSLSAAASTSFGDEVALDWYECDENGANLEYAQQFNGTFTIPSDLSAGTYYYLCQATCPSAVTKYSRVATVTVMPNIYEITQGQHGQWIKGSGVGLGFTSNGEYSKFTGVLVDSTALSAADYTSRSGSTIVTLNAAYLETLAVGRHTLRINFTDGYAETDFIIPGVGGAGGDVGSDVPKTGDAATPVLWLGLMLLAGAGLAVSAAVRRKRQNG